MHLAYTAVAQYGSRFTRSHFNRPDKENGAKQMYAKIFMNDNITDSIDECKMQREKKARIC